MEQPAHCADQLRSSVLFRHLCGLLLVSYTHLDVYKRQLLRARGLKVGVIKHDGHDFTPDVPGTDSFRLREAGAEGVAVFSGSRYLLTEEFRLNEQDLLALFERHGYDLVLMEGFKESGWPKIEVVRKAVSEEPVSFEPLAIVGDVPGADFALDEPAALADWIAAQMPAL